MTPRIAGFIFAGLFIIGFGAYVSWVLLETSRIDGATTQARIVSLPSLAVPGGTLEASATLGPETTYVLNLEYSAENAGDESPGRSPTVVLRMLDMDMGETILPLVAREPDHWRVAGAFSMAGRWAFRIEFDGSTADLMVESQ